MALQYSTTGVFKYIGNPDLTSSVNSNLDARYGPYETLNAAISATATTTDDFDPSVTYQWRYIGMTVGILNGSGGVDEYWFKNGIEDNDLIPKIPDIDAIFGNIKVAMFDANGGSGHQNSELSDGHGYIHLPQCLFTNSGGEFNGWGRTSGSSEFQAGQDVQLSGTTTFYAIWSNTTSYTVSWTNNTGYVITATANGQSISSGASVAEGTTVVFTCNVANGYDFGSWNNLPSGASTSGNTATVTVSGNISGVSCTVTEHVEPVTTYEIVVSSSDNNHGTVSGGGSYQENTTATVIATANNGYVFAGWKEGGNIVSSNATYSFTVTGNRDLVGVFETALPETVSIVGVSGAKKYNATLQTRIDNGTITCTPMTVTVGADNEIVIPGSLTDDKMGYSVLVPSGYGVSYIRLFDAQGNEYDYTITQSTLQHGLPVSSDNQTIKTTIDYNNNVYDLYSLYISSTATPTKVRFSVFLIN